MTTKSQIGQRAKFFFESTCFRLAVLLLLLAPRSKRADFYGGLSRFIGTRTGLQQRIYKNLDIGLPSLSLADKQQIADGVWRNLGRSYAELTMGEALSDLKDGIVTIKNQEAYEAIRQKGQGTVLIGAHFSNWELTILTAARVVKDFHGFYRAHANKHLDAEIYKLRSVTGAGLIAKNDRAGLKSTLKILRDGGTIGILVDQHFSYGDEISFMGTPTGTLPMAYSLAKSTGAAVLPFHLVRQEDQTYIGRFGEEIPVPRTDNTKADRQTFLTQMNEVVGSWIQQNPEQWLWLHNRWRAADGKSQLETKTKKSGD